MPRVPHPWCCRECSLGQKLIEGMCWCECHVKKVDRGHDGR
jgi:hypothetical protein